MRCDDIDMCHKVNIAVKKLIETGTSISASVMLTCPWYKEAVEILKNNSQVSVGVRLVLNSEWKYYKWVPVAGREKVLSLADSDGYFYSSQKAFAKCGYNLNDGETELRSQIERALHSGLHIDYIDAHMTTAMSTPALKTIVEKLANGYHLGVYFYRMQSGNFIQIKKLILLK